MICPVCQTSLQGEINRPYGSNCLIYRCNCNDSKGMGTFESETLDDKIIATHIRRATKTGLLVFNGVYQWIGNKIQMDRYVWNVILYQFPDQQFLGKGTNPMQPPEAYQFLQRYQNLLIFS